MRRGYKTVAEVIAGAEPPRKQTILSPVRQLEVDRSVAQAEYDEALTAALRSRQRQDELWVRVDRARQRLLDLSRKQKQLKEAGGDG